MFMAFTILACVGGVASTQFPADQIKAIVNTHNNFRSQLAKGTYKSRAGVTFAAATNVQTMVWNNTLAKSASTCAGTSPGLKHSGAVGVDENL
ncbi:unnamed protein product, partial [Mesorhabditis belari]|uniref:SCP domain-containing protein n=1 Tax=Mesorhabditis belari TaxID=2138241 RepID=A0AAF3J6P0_9BILA